MQSKLRVCRCRSGAAVDASASSTGIRPFSFRPSGRSVHRARTSFSRRSKRPHRSSCSRQDARQRASGHYLTLLDYALAATGRVVHALPGRRVPVGTRREKCPTNKHRDDAHYQEDYPNGIYVETGGGNRDSKFENGADNHQHDPEPDQPGPSSPRHCVPVSLGGLVWLAAIEVAGLKLFPYPLIQIRKLYAKDRCQDVVNCSPRCS